MRYLTLSEAIYINGRVLANPQIMSGKQGVRDVILLDAAVMRPASSAFGADAYPTLREKVAALFHSIVRNHPFADGNKRTATVVSIFMFAVNGERIVWNQVEALPYILAAAQHQREIADLAAWFPLTPCPPAGEPDAEADMRHIDQICLEQEWLLNELRDR
ncbi:MAG TPA: type II toxin-antitoxin system death-on-curing family toxin [Aggregatilineales bacterium]|nr:type II toxin-antitoxin system death-on-curing family toxin [Anaerolineales bacterium]HRE46774.1 type II toxin-antitoxin system death-on-curing family toxin [Aggregatilineales bacterium]